MKRVCFPALLVLSTVIQPAAAQQSPPRELVFSVRSWQGEYFSKDIRGGVETTPVVASIHKIKADGTGLRKIVDLGKKTEAPSFSPDGRWLYFQSNASDRYHIYRCRPDGSDVANLTAGDGLGKAWQDSYGHALSDTGDKLLYTASDGKTGRIVLAKEDGTE